jgi:hypothetical protein
MMHLRLFGLCLALIQRKNTNWIHQAVQLSTGNTWDYPAMYDADLSY